MEDMRLSKLKCKIFTISIKCSLLLLLILIYNYISFCYKKKNPIVTTNMYFLNLKLVNIEVFITKIFQLKTSKQEILCQILLYLKTWDSFQQSTYNNISLIWPWSHEVLLLPNFLSRSNFNTVLVFFTEKGKTIFPYLYFMRLMP